MVTLFVWHRLFTETNCIAYQSLNPHAAKRWNDIYHGVNIFRCDENVFVNILMHRIDNYMHVFNEFKWINAATNHIMERKTIYLF